VKVTRYMLGLPVSVKRLAVRGSISPQDSCKRWPAPNGTTAEQWGVSDRIGHSGAHCTCGLSLLLRIAKGQ